MELETGKIYHQTTPKFEYLILKLDSELMSPSLVLGLERFDMSIALHMSGEVFREATPAEIETFWAAADKAGYSSPFRPTNKVKEVGYEVRGFTVINASDVLTSKTIEYEPW